MSSEGAQGNSCAISLTHENRRHLKDPVATMDVLRVAIFRGQVVESSQRRYGKANFVFRE